jgi:hypothetical protein
VVGPGFGALREALRPRDNRPPNVASV